MYALQCSRGNLDLTDMWGKIICTLVIYMAGLVTTELALLAIGQELQLVVQ